MRTNRQIAIAFVVLAGLASASCTSQEVLGDSVEPPAVVRAIAGSDLKMVMLSEEAARRLGIQTEPVTSTGGQLSVPAAAVVYDPTGVAWVYSTPGEREFVRVEIAVSSYERDRAFLTIGPPPDTQVVTVGVPELYGTENGVGEPE